MDTPRRGFGLFDPEEAHLADRDREVEQASGTESEEGPEPEEGGGCEEEEVEQVYCIWMKPGGQRCRSYARKGSDLCYWHDPATEQERATGFRSTERGQRSTPKASGPPILPQPAVLETPEEVLALLQEVANYLATVERADTARAHALSTVAALLLKGIEIRALRQAAADARAEAEKWKEELERSRSSISHLQELRRQDYERQVAYEAALKEAGVNYYNVRPCPNAAR